MIKAIDFLWVGFKFLALANADLFLLSVLLSALFGAVGAMFGGEGE